MNIGISLFSLQHIVILAVIPAVGGALAFISQQQPSTAKWIHRSLGVVLLVSTLVWYGVVVANNWFSFPEFIPLHLCDITLWLTIIVAFTRNQFCFELTYYWGVAGTTMALVTPDVGNLALTYPTIQFFLSHGIVVISALFLVWSGRMKPGRYSLWKAFAALNIYALGIGLFNLIFHTNYMYVCGKPSNASLLDYLGTWPIYLVTSDVLALLIFWLLWIPYRRGLPSVA